jgi:glycerol kinase
MYLRRSGRASLGLNPGLRDNLRVALPHVLAIDQGGHASRALVFDARGQIVAQAFAPIATLRPAPDRVEHDPEELIGSLRSSIDNALRQIDAKAPLAAAGLATQRSSIVCWDKRDGRALSPVISWQDRRNAPLVETLRSHAASIHAQTGLMLSPHYGASKLRWCLDNLPEVKAAAAEERLVFGPLSSFLLFRLLEERPTVVDPANASRTQLWDPITRDWASDLLGLFGIDAALLPHPVSSRHAYGSLRTETRVVPLTVCTGDQSTVPFAFGPTDPNAAYVNLGTGAFIQCPLPGPLRAPRLLTSVVWSDARTTAYVLEGSVNGAASALDWFSEAEGIDAQRMLAALPPTTSATLQPPLFLNGVSGLASPFWVPDFESRFVGGGTAEEKLIAVLESILFLIRVNLDEMQHHRAALARLIVTGGLAGSDWLCQRLAALTDLPVVRHVEREATARGLAFLVAKGATEQEQPIAQRTFPPERDTALLERFFAWLKEMKRSTRGPTRP